MRTAFDIQEKLASHFGFWRVLGMEIEMRIKKREKRKERGKERKKGLFIKAKLNPSINTSCM